MNWTFNESFHRSIIFSNIPLTGNYRFADVFQIRKGDPSWPLNREELISSSPIILEYNSNYYQYYKVLNPNQSNKHLNEIHANFRHLDFKKELFALLNLTSNSRFYSANKYMLTNQELGEDFVNLTEFSDSQGETSIILDNNHITKDINHSGQSVIFPLSIDTFFSNYFKLNKEYRERFRMSLMLYYNSDMIRNYSPSMSFVALVSSIENLVDFEGKKEKIKFKTCKYCTNTARKIGFRFREFMMKYCLDDSTEFNKYLKSVYTKRSNIAHLGELLYSDFAETELDVQGENEINILKRYVRIAFYNWIIKVPQK